MEEFLLVQVIPLISQYSLLALAFVDTDLNTTLHVESLNAAQRTVTHITDVAWKYQAKLLRWSN